MAQYNNLPSNLEAEKYVISCALIDNSKANFIVNELTLDDFYSEQYKMIFESMYSLKKQNKSITFNNIIATLEESDYLKKIGGADFINSLVADLIEDKSFDDQVRLLQDKKVTRNLIKKMYDLMESYNKNNFETDREFINFSESEFLKIARSIKTTGLSNMNDVTGKILTNISIIQKNPAGLIGYDTGFSQLNKLTLGMQNGQLTVIAARPGVGKTALGLNICYNVASKSKKPVIIFSGEMGEEELGQRLLSTLTGIPSQKIATGNLSAKEMEVIKQGIKELNSTPLIIKYCNGATVGEVVNTATKFKEDGNDLAMIMVDYIGLLKSDNKNEDKRIQIGNISKALKRLANDLNIPVIAISQVRRTDNPRPAMTDLKESGDIEADADRIFLLYRDDYEGNADGKIRKTKMLNEEKSETSSDSNLEAALNQAKVNNERPSFVEVNVCKNRNGSTGVAVMLFFKSTVKFGEPTNEAIQDYKAAKKVQEA